MNRIATIPAQHGLLPRIAAAFSGWFARKSDPGGLGRWITLVSHMSDATKLGSVFNQLDAYQGHVYKCVNLISNRVGALGWHLEYSRGNETAPVDRHPFYDLAERPNPYWPLRQLIKLSQTHLDLCGRAFWRLVLDGAGRPLEIWPLVPSNFKKIHLSPDRLTIEAYEFFLRGDGTGTPKSVVYPAEEIVDFRYPHPVLLLEGASPIQASAYSYDTDMAMRVYQKRFFTNSARPDLILSSDQRISESDAERLVKLWKKRFQGEHKTHEPAVLGQGMDVKLLQVSNSDMEFATLAGWTKEDILETYSVPASMFGTTGEYRRDNMLTTLTTFNAHCIAPRLALLAEALQMQLLAKYDPGLRFAFENPVPKDREARLKERETNLKTFYSSINEERERDGLDPVPWGNEPWGTIHDMPLLSGAESSTSAAGNDGKAITQKRLEQKDRRRSNFQALHARRVLARARAMENWFKRFFADQEQEVLRALEDGYKRIDGATRGMSQVKMRAWIEQKEAFDWINIDLDKWDRALEEGIMPYLTLTVSLAGEEAMEYVGAIDIPFNDQSEAVRSAVGLHVDKIKGSVNPTTREAIRAALTAGFDAGESVQDIADRIREVFTEAKQVRSLRISRTEINAAQNAGNHEGYAQSGVVGRKEWVAGLGARDTHVEAMARYTGDGAIPLSELFEVGAGRGPYPGSIGLPEEDINCRCAELPVLTNDQGGAGQ